MQFCVIIRSFVVCYLIKIQVWKRTFIFPKRYIWNTFYKLFFFFLVNINWFLLPAIKVERIRGQTLTTDMRRD